MGADTQKAAARGDKATDNRHKATDNGHKATALAQLADDFGNKGQTDDLGVVPDLKSVWHDTNKSGGF